MNKVGIYKHYNKHISLYIPCDAIEKELSNCFLKNLIITQIGYFEDAYGHSIEREGIHEHIMLYCTGGKGWVNTGAGKDTICKGDLVFCQADHPHGYGADDINPWSIHWTHFMGDGVPELFRILGISPQSSILHVGEQPELVSLVEEACNTLSNGYSFPNLFHASTCFQEFFCLIVKRYMYSRLQSSNGFDIGNVVDLMRKNVQADFTLKQFADYMKMSKYHFARKFKEITGYPPMEYFNRMKIQKACELLDTSPYSIKEISNYLSFSNPFYFSEVFKKITGYSPSIYKQSQKAF